jgi:hypothetical protein
MPLTRIVVLIAVAGLASTNSALAQTAVNYIGPSGGLWSNASSWMPAVVPNNAGGTTYGVTVSSGRTVNLDINATVASFNLSGTIDGSGNLTANAASVWTSGTLGGAGTTTIASGGTLRLDGFSTKSFGGSRAMSNQGTVIWSQNSDIRGSGSAGTTIDNSGLFDAQNDASFASSASGATHVFNNSGTFRKSGGTTSTDFFRWAFNNTGTVEVQTGTLVLPLGESNGHFNIAAPATLRFAGDHNLADAEIAGAGSLEFSSGTTNIVAATLTGLTGPMRLTGGTLNIAGAMTAANSFTWTGGTLGGAGTTTIPSGGTLRLDGFNTKTFAGSRALTNQGTVTWTGGGDIWGSSSAETTINNSGLFDAQSDDLFNSSSSSPSVHVFNNSGTFRKSGGTGSTSFSRWAFNNFGTVDMQSGTLIMPAGESSGNFTIAGPATLRFAGDHNLADAEISGAGSLEFASGTTSIGAATLTGLTGPLRLTGGTLNIAGDMVAPNSFTWTGGTLGGAGTTTIPSGRTLRLDGFGTKSFGGSRALANQGTVVWNGGGDIYGSSTAVTTINNGGLFDVQDDQFFSSNGPSSTVHMFNNSGTFRKSGGISSTTFSRWTFNNSGTVDVQSGALILPGGAHSGSFAVGQGSRITFSGTQMGSPASEINNSGVVEITGTSSFGPLQGNGRTSLTSSARLTVGGVRQSELSIGSNATTTIRPDSATSVLGNLVIAGTPTSPSGKLDINNSALVIDYPAPGANPIANVRQQITAGRGGPGLGKIWDGRGITSVAAAAADLETRSVGYADNATLPLGAYTSFRGTTVDNTSLLIAFTRTGDANLDGVVDDNDVTIVGAYYAPGKLQPDWTLGDFDYSGFVDDDDVTLLGVFYEPTATPIGVTSIAPLGQVAAVPEPASLFLSLLGVVAIGLFILRRR